MQSSGIYDLGPFNRGFHVDSNGRVLVSDASSSNASLSYVNVQDQKASGVAGGTFTSGAWRTRDLTIKVTDTDSIATLSSNQVTLQSGTYCYFAMAHGAGCDEHQLRLRNITDTETVDVGMCAKTTTPNLPTLSVVSGKFVITVATTFEIQHKSIATRATDGFGVPCGFGTEVYAIIEFLKIGEV